MITNINEVLCTCCNCKKKLWRYTTLCGYVELNDFIELEFGSPEIDQIDNRFYCLKCWKNEKTKLDKLEIKYRIEKRL